MVFAIPFPEIGPEIFSVTFGGVSLALRWYAVAYIAGLLIGLWIVRRILARPHLWPAGHAPMTGEQAEGLLTAVVIGVVVGGRLGFVLFYQPGYYLANPLDIPKLWQGGMAFHGGLAGVVVAAWMFCRRNGLPAAQIADAMALATPPGLFLGRIANFINGELWGRPSSAPWAVIFPGEAAQACPTEWPDPCARHPSQLYEAGLEGLVLGVVLLWVVRRGGLRHSGLVTGVFLAGYAVARIFVEAFRQADAQFVTMDNPLGHVLRFGDAGLTMGQLLSLPLLVIGAAIIAAALVRARHGGAA
jgi:phosphatidylglycerol:prolipoprotein diacylglycerol transferase